LARSEPAEHTWPASRVGIAYLWAALVTVRLEASVLEFDARARTYDPEVDLDLGGRIALGRDHPLLARPL
jgi:hypothetical protein